MNIKSSVYRKITNFIIFYFSLVFRIHILFNSFVYEPAIELNNFSGESGPNRQPDGLGRTPVDGIILENWVFENSILADETFEKAEIGVLVNNNSWGKVISSLELQTIFNENLKLLLYRFLFSIYVY